MTEPFDRTPRPPSRIGTSAVVRVLANAGWKNLSGSAVLAARHWIEDTEGYAMELRYLRDTDRREVDFVVLKDRKPLFAVECKSGDKAIGPALIFNDLDRTKVKLLGTALWADASLNREDSLAGGWFAAPEPRPPQPTSATLIGLVSSAPRRI